MLRYGAQEATRFIIETNLLNSTSNEFKGIIEGLAVVYDKPDIEGYVIKKGAFDNQDFRNIRLPMKWEHLSVLNTGWAIKKTDEGLYVKGQIPKEILNKPFIQEYLQNAQKAQNKTGRYLGAGLSGYIIYNSKDTRINPDSGHREILKAILTEVSLVIEPKNPNSMITLAQSANISSQQENEAIIINMSIDNLEEQNMTENIHDETKLYGARRIEYELKKEGIKPDRAKELISMAKIEFGYDATRKGELMTLQQGVPQNKERDVSFTCNECEARKLQSQKGENQKSENQPKFKIIKTKQ